MADSKADSWAVPKDASKADLSVDRRADRFADQRSVLKVVHLVGS